MGHRWRRLGGGSRLWSARLGVRFSLPGSKIRSWFVKAVDMKGNVRSWF